MSRTLYIGDYHLSSWSMRPWLALHAGGIAFDTVVVPLDRPGSAEALGRVSPTRKVPVLDDGGTRIWESLAICETAAELSPALWPADRLRRAWARSVATEMHGGFPHLRKEHPMQLLLRTPRAPSTEVRSEIARIEALVAGCRERHAGLGPFLFGAFSIADAMYAPVCTRFRTYALPVGPVTEAWCAAVLSHPSVREWERRAVAEAGAPDAG